MQGAADAGPSVTAAGTGVGAVSSFAGGDPGSLGDSMGGEQSSAANSALKTIQPGNVNGFNSKMQKSAGANYKSVDFLSG